MISRKASTKFVAHGYGDGLYTGDRYGDGHGYGLYNDDVVAGDGKGGGAYSDILTYCSLKDSEGVGTGWHVIATSVDLREIAAHINVRKP